MVQKVLGVCALVLGLAISVFAGMAYLELDSAATSETAPPADSMPFTKIVGPELFDPGNAGAKPAALARTTFNRIYMIGGCGIVLAFVAVLILAFPRSHVTKHIATL